MTLRDQVGLALGNLGRTRLRTLLTTLGVVIGIGAMTSMVSVGSGMQRNVLKAFNEQNLLTTVTVQPAGAAPMRSFDPDDPDRGAPRQGRRQPAARASGADSTSGRAAPPLDDEAVRTIMALPGVRAAWPSLTVSGLVRLGEGRRYISLEGMPPEPLREGLDGGRLTLLAGRVYGEGEEGGVVLSERLVSSLAGEGVSPDSLVGTTVTFLIPQAPGAGGENAPPTRTLEPGEMGLPSFLQGLPVSGLLRAMGGSLMQVVELHLEVLGVLQGAGTFGDYLGTAVYVPMETVRPLYSRALLSMESVLTGETRGDEYASVQARVRDVSVLPEVEARIEGLGFRATSLLDDLDEIRRGFVLLNSFLAVLGGVSLFVAMMMIVNTLVMSVIERTREIGLLKALGATSNDITRLFLAEAGVIGLMGWLGGLLLGWVVARITNLIVNYGLLTPSDPHIDIVAYPLWLVLGSLGVAVLVSLAAGWYPARRAARVDPVVALRYF